jgi:mono/diheme cytochrome c family protein
LKARLQILSWFLLLFLLGGCTFTLAADITPPPDYRSPTPPPTLGPLYPAEAPSVTRGAAIYAEKCLSCHGERGLGDGPQGKQLPVRVTALGLPEIGRAASPAEWYRVVTQGRMDRMMPPFRSLSDQQRWDVVAYAWTLHTSAQEIEEGRQIFERLCAACDTRLFRQQEEMAQRSDQELFDWVTKGSAAFPAIQGISETEAWKVVAYLRSLSFAEAMAASLTATPTPAPQTPTPVSTPAPGTPEPVETAAPGTPAETPASPAAEPGGTAIAPSPEAGATGTLPVAQVVSGKVEAAGGAQLPSSLSVTLYGYEADANSMPVEKVRLTSTLAPDGSYRFEGVEMPAGRVFLAEVRVDGVRYVSSMSMAQAGQGELSLPTIRIYPVTEDFGQLRIAQVHLQVDVGEGQLQVFNVYSVLNPSQQVVRVKTDGSSLPFLSFPEGASQTGIELSQDSASLLEAEGGIALPPSDQPYGFIAFYTLPYTNRVQLRQPFPLGSDSLIVILPQGMQAQGEGIEDAGTRTFQGNVFHLFRKNGIASGSTLELTISGRPQATSVTSLAPSQSLWLGAGALGVALIVIGMWFYLRGRRSMDEEEELEESPYETEEEVLDAILALDDLHRAGKLSDAAYQERRAELKALLEEMRRHD